MRRLLTILIGELALAWCCAATSAQPAPPVANYVPPPVPPAPTATASDLKAIYTRQSEFAIPFKIDAAAKPAQRPTAVQLHVSEDGGLNWRLYEQVDPAAGRFTFRAPHDGDFQFFVRTVDTAGRLQPAAPPKGELRVVVDTLPPRLELTAEQSPSGEIVAHWRMLDRNLRPQTFKLEFQAAGGTRWQTVTVPQEAGAERLDSGEITFWPGASAEKLLIRGQVIDQAGNPAVAQTDLAARGSMHTASNRNDERDKNRNPQTAWQPIDEQPSARGVRWNSGESAAQPVSQTTRRTEELAPPAAVEAIAPGEQLPDLGTSQSSQQDQIDAPPAGPRTTPVGNQVDAAIVDGYETETSNRPPTSASEPGLPEPVSAAPTLDSAAHEQTHSAPAETSALPRAAQFGFDRLPSGQQPRMVNSRRFELDYEVQSIGSVGVAKIELWGTRDWGQTWTSFGFDNDNRSPFQITVDQEGMYGFRIVIEAANGLGGLPPRSGDEPDVWVGVDLTKPKARLLGVEELQEGGLGALKIQWEAEDVLLAANPITIAYSEQPAGPWNTIVEGIDNSGEYRWRIDRRLPDRIYLQIQARDEAGNVGIGQRQDPVSLERLRPQGRIREIRPARDARRGGGWTILR